MDDKIIFILYICEFLKFVVSQSIFHSMVLVIRPKVFNKSMYSHYAKSNIYPINVSTEKMDLLFKTFNCHNGSFPFT
jgi:hypothetical protein